MSTPIFQFIFSKPISLLVIGFLSFGHIQSQPIEGLVSSDSVLSKLDDKERISYINDNFYTIYSASFENAKELTGWAIKTANGNNWRLEEATASMNYGVVTYLRGEYDEALSAFLVSKKLFDSLKYAKGKAMLFTEMANYYRKTGHMEKVFPFLDSAEILSRSVNDQLTLSKSYGMRAYFLYEGGFIDEAKNYSIKDYEIKLAQDDSIGLGYIFLDLAKYAQSEGDFNQALIYIDQSLKIRELINDQQAISENLCFLGDTYLKEKRYSEAIKYYKQCVSHTKKVNYPDQRHEAYKQLVIAYKQINDYKQAIIYQDSSYLLKDSLFNLARTKTIEEFQIKYESEKKDRHILEQAISLKEKSEVLQKQILIIFALGSMVLLLYGWYRIKKKQQQMKSNFAMNRERTRIAMDLHDHVGAELTLVSSKLDVRMYKTERLKDKEDLVVIADQIRDVNATLRETVWSIRSESIQISELLDRVEKFAKKMLEENEITYTGQTNLPSYALAPQHALALYRICQEGITNTFKYAKAQNIKLSLDIKDDQLAMQLTDDGIGFSPEQVSTGYGLRNIEQRVNQLDGQFSITSATTGTSLSVKIVLK